MIRMPYSPRRGLPAGSTTTTTTRAIIARRMSVMSSAASILIRRCAGSPAAKPPSAGRVANEATAAASWAERRPYECVDMSCIPRTIGGGCS